MKQKTSALLSLGLCGILAAAVAVVAVRNHRGGEEKVLDERVVVETAAAPEEEQSGFLDGLFQQSEPTAEPTAAPSPTPEPTATPVPDPEVTAQPSRAPEGYFADAAFVGNSVVTGLDMYDYDDVLAGADFYAANSVTVLGVSDYIRQMEGTVYGKVYVGLGTNEMSYDKDTLRGCFEDMIDMLLDYNPDCIIYLMSVTPVSEYKSSTNSSFTKELAIAFNEMLREIARDRGVYYLDVYSVLCNDQGYLPSEVTVDGIHFTPAHYAYWFDYLQTHYVPDGGAPAPAEPSPMESAPAQAE